MDEVFKLKFEKLIEDVFEIERSYEDTNSKMLFVVGNRRSGKTET